jgi:hypothetical protein
MPPGRLSQADGPDTHAGGTAARCGNAGVPYRRQMTANRALQPAVRF